MSNYADLSFTDEEVISIPDYVQLTAKLKKS